jgi:hypothetical protein
VSRGGEDGVMQSLRPRRVNFSASSRSARANSSLISRSELEDSIELAEAEDVDLILEPSEAAGAVLGLSVSTEVRAKISE